MRTRTIVWTAAAVLVLVLAGVGTAFVLRDGDHNEAATPAASSAGPAPVLSATASPSPQPSPGADLTGPLDLLLIGLDTRVSIPDWQPHADAIMLLHVDAGLRSGYLYSLPRDLRVDIPGVGRHKITEAMSYGAKVPGTDKADVHRGYALLSRTISSYTGIKKFDAGAILTFGGLSKLTDALGGVTLRIDQKVLSHHRRPDGSMRPLAPGGGDYLGPQAVYQPGIRKLVGWQAIDYARQRYGLPNGDYDRQRHQRQLVAALFGQAMTAGLADDPAKLTGIITALGDSVVVTGGRSAVEYAYALRDLAPSRLTMVSLPGDSVLSGGSYLGEQLNPEGRAFLKAVATGDPGAYLKAHPKLVSK
ncbi:LCP family protein [Actinoplanes sp. N902-109]|uniref:LCP family protein n=1 Tax=Actinoplanes sp. (strain N902-109) TaxID=649831 RepID=UPI0003293A97|nr:LCP family protein [Actinoplanes sp. N902-109]AGL14532.1 LytR/CpsA family cell envelope-related function transcriptional attenuator [Actinoplanes sp. N902-109]